MNEAVKSKTQSAGTDFEKIFDNLRRSLNDYSDADNLDGISDDSDYKASRIAFPYGSNRPRPYNFNLK